MAERERERERERGERKRREKEDLIDELSRNKCFIRFLLHTYDVVQVNALAMAAFN
jgi:hypothetical protein